MIDMDMDLKRSLDQRLAGFIPPPRPARRGGSRTARVLVGAGIATLLFAGAGLAMDVESVAAANGGECVNLIAKIELWFKKVSSAITPLDMQKHVAKIACDGQRSISPAIDKGGADPKAPAQPIPPMSNWD